MANHGNVVYRGSDGTIIDHDQCGNPFVRGTFERIWDDSGGNRHWQDDDTVSWEDSNGNTHYR
jgi:hypothetical protein